MNQQFNVLVNYIQGVLKRGNNLLTSIPGGSKVFGRKEQTKRKRENAVVEVMKTWLSLPPPGRVDEHNREAVSITPDTFQGFRGEFNRFIQTLPVTPEQKRAFEAGVLSFDDAPRLLVTHQCSLMRAPTLSFAGQQMNPRGPSTDNIEEQVFSAQYSWGPLTMHGRIGSSRSVFALLSWAQRRGRLTLQGEIPKDERRRAAYSAEGVCSIGPSTTSVRVRSSDRILMVGHMQALTRRIAVGAEYLRTPDDCAVQYALRAVIRGGNAVVAALGSLKPRSLALTYTQRITARLRCCVGIDVQPRPRADGNTAADINEDTKTSWKNMTSAAVVGYEYSSSDGDVIVKGQVDTRGNCSTSVEEALDDAVRIIASAQINPFQHSYVWGLGFSCTS